ncbi:hypothetical protein NQ314_004186 [Rhamnusium bicolor]|uniref:Uncharacterized protein n=1 Tax=Rhamnusium bicolor TaxID=1586634 RepID=A0AAV8ZK85_9CUCU|nr:hypothetical protein NQ314_004186 [Rhamnusium bicolor]
MFRYTPKDLKLTLYRHFCDHRKNNNTKKFECLDIPIEILVVVKEKIFQDNIKISQDARISTLLVVNHPRHSRSQSEKPETAHLTFNLYGIC